ncbi:MAG: peptide-methionine (R)-S-oxide reductase MsrB [Pseudomonadales bacterium]|nr:peptide-methionine (R)-S-oxide reductase MsrB [Pseudomonadales bacterium]
MNQPEDNSYALWKQKLSPEQYKVCRCSATEAPFSGVYWDYHERGVYHCACCDEPLFDSQHKFDSGTGWPSFFQAADNVSEQIDRSHGMIRTEVRCATCQAHLGHVFEDGPAPSGRRFCVNSLSLVFKGPSEV